MAANNVRLERLERHHTNQDDGAVWLAWHGAEVATCGVETKSLEQLAAEGSKLISLTWGDD